MRYSSSGRGVMVDLEEQFRGKRILITGGLGFIGSNLARRLISLRARVTLIDSLVPEYGGNPFNLDGIERDLAINISDVRDVHSLRHLIAGQDFLFNLAGQTSHIDSMRDPFTDLEINCRSQLSIMETCRIHNPGIRIVFASTRQLYGRPDYLPVDEKHLVRPVDINGIHKAAGEAYHTLYHDVYGMRSCALRLTNTYGPRMRIKDARQTFLGVWIRNALRSEPIEVWGGSQLRDFNYVDDVVDAFLLAATSNVDGRVMNIGSDEIISLLDVAAMLQELEPSVAIRIMEYPEERKKIDIGDYYADFSLARDTLHWRPEVRLRDGLRRTLDYYRAHLAHYLDESAR